MKAIDDVIKDIAKNLPPMFYRYRQTFRVTKDDIKNHGLGICDHEYYIEASIKKDVNHKRRMSRAYKSHGLKGIKSYVSGLFG